MKLVRYASFPLVAIYLSMSILPAEELKPIAKAGADTIKIKLTKVVIQIDEGGVKKPWSGQLFKSTSSVLKRTYVSGVSENGLLDTPIECDSNENFVVEANHELALNRSLKPQACSSSLSFVVKTIRLADFPDLNLEIGNQLAAAGEYGKAHSAFSTVYAEAMKRDKAKIAGLASEKALASFAKALGDKNLQLFVVRDPLQDNRLVLSNAGVDQLKNLQKVAGLKVTGDLDFKTQVYLETANLPAIRERVTAPSQ